MCKTKQACSPFDILGTKATQGHDLFKSAWISDLTELPTVSQVNYAR